MHGDGGDPNRRSEIIPASTRRSVTAAIDTDLTGTIFWVVRRACPSKLFFFLVLSQNVVLIWVSVVGKIELLKDQVVITWCVNFVVVVCIFRN
jgi:hypothetical protein